MLRKIYATIFLSLLLTGCATNLFQQYYFDQTGGVDITKLPNYLPSPETPQLFRGSNIEEDAQKMLEAGYALIGYSSFNAGSETPSAKTNLLLLVFPMALATQNTNTQIGSTDVIAFGKKVHAATILLYSKYTNTLSGVMPITLPDTTTIQTNASATGHSIGVGNYSGMIYGSDINAMYSGRSNTNSSSYVSGSATTTITGNKTTYVPYNVNRYDYFASYWFKVKPTQENTRAMYDSERLTDSLSKNVVDKRNAEQKAVIQKACEDGKLDAKKSPCI